MRATEETKIQSSRKIAIKQQPDKDVPTEVMAQAIVDIAASMKKLMNTRLKRDAIVTLVQHDTKFGRGTIETVMISLEDLEQTYLKPKDKK